jgi:putative cardiolipin synthase
MTRRIWKVARSVLSVLAVVAMMIMAARWVFPLPDISGRPHDRAIPASRATLLGQLMTRMQAVHPNLTGVAPLSSGQDALTSRLALIAQAEVSIDAQYYIWHDDTAGILLFDALARAAKRGVRVRLLLDDNGVPGLDSYLAALNAQDNFDIRLFNPSTIRRPKMAGYAFDLFRMNRRMHNKSLTVDGAATIIGGRNIGDEYFGIGEAFYVDMDVLAIGPIVPDVSAAFDQYWNSASVFGVEDIVDGAGDRAAFDVRTAAVKGSAEARKLVGELQSSAARYADGVQMLEWTRVQLVADDPVKGQGIATPGQLMIHRLGAILGSVQDRLDLVSAYFVPGKQGTEFFVGLARKGKQVNILTNALNTTDVLLVHAGYTKYRRSLLEGGVKLYELKQRSTVTPESEHQLNPLGLSGASLHAKTFAIDGARVFIGSFNFDPRSAMLNCEMGLLIESPAIARHVSAVFDGPLAQASYRPELTAEGRLIWRERDVDGRVVTRHREPGATWFRQIALAVTGFLPVEWLL